MKTFIPEDLTSVYDLTVPYVFDVRKLRKQLDAELEKLHPCFPDRCVADYRFRFHPYGKQPAGFHVRAVVMDRLQLAALRKSNAGCTLYLGGNRPYAVFSREILRRRVVLSAALLCTLLAVLLTVRFSAQRSSSETVPEALSSAQQTLVPAVETEEPAATPPVFDQADFSPFIKTLYEKEGRLTACSWNADTGLFSFRTEGLFPEQLAQAAPETVHVSFGPVSYREGVPEVEVSFFYGTCFSFQGDYSVTSVTTDVPDMAVIRNLFFESGGVLASETVNPPSLTGNVSEDAWASFSASLTEMLSKAGVSVLKLSRESGGISVFLEFCAPGQKDQNAFSWLVSLPLSDVTCVFDDAPGLPFEKPPHEDERQVTLMKAKEIGRIKRNDGSSVVFFHNEDGKIERRIYEN